MRMATEFTKRREERRKSQSEKAMSKADWGRQDPPGPSGMIAGLLGRRYIGTNSSWSMSRIWNNLKQGIGKNGTVPKATVQQPKIKAAEPASSIVKSLKEGQTSSIDDAIWQPIEHKFKPDEIKRV